MADAQTPIAPPAPLPAETGLSAQAVELLEFVRAENQANRSYFTTLVRWFGGGIAFILLVAGFFGWKSFNDLKDHLQQQAQKQVQDEITRMQGEIRTKLEQEFSTPVMKKSIHDAAADAVQTAVTSQISAELSSLRAETYETRSDVNKYVMPRVVTPQQKAELKSYLSTHKPFGFISIRYAVHDNEAEAYADQLAEAFRAGGWQAGTAGDFTQRLTPSGGQFPGMGIWVEAPKDFSPTAVHDQNQFTLSSALAAAHLPTFGSGSIGLAYQLYIYVGPRPLDISAAPAKRAN